MPKMNAMRQHSRILVGAVFLICSAAALISCGDGRDAASNLADRIPQGSIQACLRREGAETAQSAADLSFLLQAEANEEVSKVGFAADRRAKIFVHLWTAAGVENKPPLWIAWIGQPVNESLSPSAIIAQQPAKSYVMYVVNPAPSLRRDVEKCLEV
jgi:hypothetical protein